MVSISVLRGRVALKQTAPTIVLVLNSFVWYILATVLFRATVNGLAVLESEKLELLVLYFASIGISALIGSKFFPKERKIMLFSWAFIGTAATLLLVTLNSIAMPINILASIFFGFSIGVGLPSCLSDFADSTSNENRGLTAGIIWSCAGFTVLGIAFITNALGPLEMLVTLAFWRFLGGIGFLVLTKGRKQNVPQKAPSYSEVIHKREILLYLLPWVLFLLINFAEIPVLENNFNAALGQNSFAFIQLAEFAFIGAFAIIGGAVADKIGRKKVIIAGFIMLGIEYATISIFSITSVTSYLFLALDGATWGLLFSVFLTVLWGDLGENRQKEKYYVLGGLPYILANVVSLFLGPFASDLGTGVAFSFASFFLFVAVIPLMYAPETLPEKTMKDRELRNYIEKAQKEVEKARERKNETENKQGKCALNETELCDSKNLKVDQEEMDKACEIAGKYY
jgi:MFS family permease